jgi:hypothetical protein
MDLTAKLQIKPGQTVAAVGAPEDVPPLGDAANPAAEPGNADAVVAFVRNRAELGTGADAAIAAARLDRLAWIAYPKAGKLGTDLNRDILAAVVSSRGVRPVRQVAIDETWSALRFRPALPGTAARLASHAPAASNPALPRSGNFLLHWERALTAAFGTGNGTLTR